MYCKKLVTSLQVQLVALSLDFPIHIFDIIFKKTKYFFKCIIYGTYICISGSITDVCKCCCRSGFIRFLLCSGWAYHKTSFIYLGLAPPQPHFRSPTSSPAPPSSADQQVCQTICMEFTICVDEVSPKSLQVAAYEGDRVICVNCVNKCLWN